MEFGMRNAEFGMQFVCQKALSQRESLFICNEDYFRANFSTAVTTAGTNTRWIAAPTRVEVK